jgi:hypothetical protein
MDIHFPVPIAIFLNDRVLQHFRMFFHPMDILSLVPIAEYANVPIWQHLRTYFHPMDMEIRGSSPILVRANGLVPQQLCMC